MEDGNDTGTAAQKKFVFECSMCGESCKRRTIPVLEADLSGWVIDGTIERVLPFLKMTTVDGEMVLELVKGEGGHCALYHTESGKCTIHYNKPLDCRAFPLGFDGDRYYVRFKDCPGLGAGDMTKERLAEMREQAHSAFDGGTSMAASLPILQMVFYRKVMEDSMKAMENLSDSDKESLEGILEKTKKVGGMSGDDDVEEVEVKLDDAPDGGEEAGTGSGDEPGAGGGEGSGADAGDVENGDGKGGGADTSEK